MRQPGVLAAGFAKRADLLAQDFVLGSQFAVLAVEVATGFDCGDVVPEFHERRTQLYENHAKLTGQRRGLA